MTSSEVPVNLGQSSQLDTTVWQVTTLAPEGN